MPMTAQEVLHAQQAVAHTLAGSVAQTINTAPLVQLIAQMRLNEP